MTVSSPLLARWVGRKTPLRLGLPIQLMPLNAFLRWQSMLFDFVRKEQVVPRHCFFEVFHSLLNWGA
jgi:hypothetical protein